MKKWAYPLLIAFVAFFIFSNPARAGTQGRQFVIWVGDLAGAAGEFLDGLFDDSVDANTDDSNLISPNTESGSSGFDNSRSFDNSSSDGNSNDGGGDRFDTLVAPTADT